MSITGAIAVPHPPLILPDIGKGEERCIQNTIDAYHAAARFLAGAQPETLVLLSPHTEVYTDWFHISPGAGAAGSFARFGAPQLRVEAAYDETLAAGIAAEAEDAGVPAGFAGQREPQLDHATMIPLWFLQKELPQAKLVRIGISGLPYAAHVRLGRCIATAAGDKPVGFVASADLSHRLKENGPYGFVPQGPVLDAAITAALAAADFKALLAIDPHLADKGAECGLRSLMVMAGALDGRAVTAKLLSYQDVTGVGYAVATFAPGAVDEKRRLPL